MTAAVMSFILLCGLFITGGFTILFLMQTHDTNYRDFAALALFCAMLSMLAYHTELNASDFAAKIIAIKFGYLGKAIINPLLLMLGFRYYDVKISPIVQTGLFIVPLSTLGAVFTCEKHRIFYSSLTLLESGAIDVKPGPLYYVYIGYNTVLAMVFISYCLYQRAGLARRDKTNNTLLLAGCVVPLLSLLLYLSGWTQHFDTAPLGLMCGAIIMSVAIFRYGLLNKDEILQNMATGLIFLDGENHLVYANRAALRMIPELASYNKMHPQDLSPLCSDEFDSIQTGVCTYQRRISEWSNGDGQHGKLLTFDDVTEIRARLNRDEMTGLLNHATFYPMLDSAMLSGAAVSVSIADIDFFKRINDNYGHANGDIVLIEMAHTLENTIGTKGDVFRYGGEEFAVIFHCDEQTAEETMQKALDRFSEKTFDFMDKHVTFSFGSAQFDGAEKSVTLFDRADQIMYT
ncbi:MAG: diguanylate cyclase, partial [Oscillospiraceae bacterium]|nr:diguanylate cyclase [Oscillospiraceae bacterium]